MVVNAANADVGLALFESEAETLAASVKRIPRAMLAVQGPESRSLLSSRIPQAADLSFMKAIELPNGQFLSATGYTGEDGFEIALAADDADRFAEEILAGDALQLAGLGARDSLRLEAGLCLHGQDLSEETTPYEAGLGWSISRRALGEGGFRGDVALRKAAASQPARRLVGLLPQGRAPVRSGVQLYSRHGNATGTVTSGGFSPTLSRPIAMGYIAAEFSVEGTRIEAEVRGRRVPCEVTALPFVPHRVLETCKEMSERRYSGNHEWVRMDGKTATVGISEFAQDSLGELVYVELPDIGREIGQGEEVGVLESVKAASELYAPASGVVTELNAALEDQPSLVNESPLEEGWLFKMTLKDPSELASLSDEASYLGSVDAS